jgi:folate-binding Fe-S cluster repair protein YgfZ
MNDYTAIREGAALVTDAPRALIALSGKDRASFLHGLLTNDILALRPGTGCYAAWLTSQGRMITDLHVLESGDMILLDVPASMRETVLQKLDQFIFSEDVQVGDLTGALREVGVHGPAAAAAVERVVELRGLEGWAPYTNARADFAGTPVVVARIDQLGVPGFTMYVDAGRGADLEAVLEAAGAIRAGEQAITAARIEAGIEPRAISFSKGCYVGQVVIIRVLHRGHGRVARRLVGLRLGNGGAPPRGTRIQAGGKDAGFITSAVHSPRFGPIALGYVHRDLVAPGTTVDVEAADGPAPATVSALPFA